MKDGQTIGQWLNWDFKTKGVLMIKDNNGNVIYSEFQRGYWVKNKFDSQDNRIYLENSNGYWNKREFDSKGNQTYLEDSNGFILDNRTPEIKVIKYNGRNYQLIP
jgi:hypothetical protein